MNNPDDMPVDVDEARAWLREHKDARHLSWPALSKASGIPTGTLSTWMLSNYQGDAERVARRVIKYRQGLESQAERAEVAQRAGVAERPNYIGDLPTARRLRTLMIMAHSGEITVAGTGPGTGKTTAMLDYAACVANVWTVTARPETKTLSAMIAEVLRSVTGQPGNGWLRQMSGQVMDQVKGRRGLIIIDEANHLVFEALETLRAWHDLTGVGICLLGNEELIARIRGGGARHALARLNSRIAMTHVQDLPMDDDIESYLDAWHIENKEQRAMLRRIGLTPGAGGLREIRQVISQASMLAAEDDVPMALSHVRDVLATRATRHLRNAA